MSNNPSTDHNKDLKFLCHPQRFHPQPVINLHECDVFVMMLRDGSDSQNGANENQKRIGNAKFLSIPIPREKLLKLHHSNIMFEFL